MELVASLKFLWLPRDFRAQTPLALLAYLPCTLLSIFSSYFYLVYIKHGAHHLSSNHLKTLTDIYIHRGILFLSIYTDLEEN